MKEIVIKIIDGIFSEGCAVFCIVMFLILGCLIAFLTTGPR